MKKHKYLLSCAAIIGAAYCFVQCRQLKVSDYTVSCENLPENFDGKKFLLLADLHKRQYGINFNNLLNSCIAAKPDYIFFCGDLYSRTETDMSPKILLMHRLIKLAPVYYILGNHEINNMPMCNDLCQELENIGIHVLRNGMERIYCGDQFINVYGTEIPLEYYKNTDGSYTNIPSLTTQWLEENLGKVNENQCNILLSHNPLYFEQYAKWGANAVFSGHCHGGIVRLPFIGGIFSPERKFFPKYTKGVYETESGGRKCVMTVSAGLGKFRLNNPAEIVVCTLTN